MLNNDGRTKAVFSMALGFLVSLSKLVPMFILFFQEDIGANWMWGRHVTGKERCTSANWMPECVAGWASFFFLMFCVFLAAWIPVKIYFAFICDSHVWNLSGGCVEVPKSILV